MSTYTEKEAKKRWCPYARIIASETDDLKAAAHGCYNRVYIEADGFDPDGATNRNPSMARCIASDCMLWRWKARFGTDPENPENCAVLPSTHGYCGLAGRPK